MSANELGNKKRFYFFRKSIFAPFYLVLIGSIFLFAACDQLEKPKPEPFYSQTEPPQKQEFRWSNGKTPKSFDPAIAVAPPETDIVRAIFDGLTDTDAKTLETIPAVAKDWKSSDGDKVWTFNLRRDAKWSNGETVKAQDFARSWKRAADLGEQVFHHELLGNIVGVKPLKEEIAPVKKEEEIAALSKKIAAGSLPLFPRRSETNSAMAMTNTETKAPDAPKNSNSRTKIEPKPEPTAKPELKFGVEAIDNFTLKVSLVKPDKDFPSLVAHPIFRPVYGDGRQFETGKLKADIVTNGAFRVFSIGADGITLDRADFYWNKSKVELERVRFVPTENAEKALEAYRSGEIDAVTNADFEPLALKLLTPFDDFKLTPHAALNYYEINIKKKPFDDRRVREALAIAIERDRLTEDDLDGASQPALSFLPFNKDEDRAQLSEDANRAKNLLAEAGFPDGKDFPAIKMLINRNNVQQRIAKSVAKMWKQNLNVETEIVVRDAAELDAAAQTGDFDIIRRGVVLGTTDETANMRLIFDQNESPTSIEDSTEKTLAQKDGEIDQKILNPKAGDNVSEISNQVNQPQAVSPIDSPDKKILDETIAAPNKKISILTDEEAVRQARAIPLYFPTSYSLVKSYVEGFEINSLDAPSLKDVKINYDWYQKTKKSE